MRPIIEDHKKLLKLIAKAEATKSKSDGFFHDKVYIRHENITKKMSLDRQAVKNLAHDLKECGFIEFLEREEWAVRLTSAGQDYLSEKNFSKSLSPSPMTKRGEYEYVHSSRIEELKQLNDFDPTKLIRICEELNIVFNNKCYFATAMLLRSIIDHIPPIFKLKSFEEIANNYKGTESFKKSMQHLQKSLRNIADAFLHTQIRIKEVLPNSTQVDFSNDLDVFLGEVVRIGCYTKK